MSKLKEFLKTEIAPIVSDLEFTEDNYFYPEVMKSVDELLETLAPENESEDEVNEENE